MTNSNEYSNEITLKEFILKLQYYGKLLLSKWYIIGLVAILFGALFGYRAYVEKDKYVAELTFMVNEESSSSVGAFAASVLGRFVGGGGKYNLEKILSLSKSKMILEKTFFVKKNVNGQTDYLANFFIKEYKLNEKTKDGLLDGFLFKKDTISSELDSKMMANLFGLMTGKKGIFSSSSDERSGIMTLKLICSHEELAVEFINALYGVLSEYYINNSIEKDLLTYNLLKQKADLLYGQMNSKLDESISYDDKTLGVWKQTYTLPSLKSLRDSRISTEMYGEVMKNLEIADFTLKSKTPFINEVDIPRIPLDNAKNSLIKQILIGLFLGAFLSAFYIIIRRVVKISMM